jgi:hypothetical protein
MSWRGIADSIWWSAPNWSQPQNQAIEVHFNAPWRSNWWFLGLKCWFRKSECQHINWESNTKIYLNSVLRSLAPTRVSPRCRPWSQDGYQQEEATVFEANADRRAERSKQLRECPIQGDLSVRSDEDKWENGWNGSGKLLSWENHRVGHWNKAEKDLFLPRLQELRDQTDILGKTG